MRISGTGEPFRNTGMLAVLAGLGLLLVPGIGRSQVPAYTIATVAGTGTGGFAGDGGPATAAQINAPCALLLDGSGNLYIGDQLNYRVRKMAMGGNISTAVGTGTAGDSGATATAAAIRTPCGLALDSGGNLYFSDTANHEVKKVASGGGITTIAGNGTGGYSGDGNPATTATLNNPIGLALDAAGNVYVAEAGNHIIRKIATNGTISTFAGSGTGGYLGDGGPASFAQLNNPTGLTIDAQGNFYVADSNNGVIRKITAGGGTITTVAGNGVNAYSGDGGLATKASLNHPKGIAVDAAGNLYIADTVDSRIRVVTPDGIINTVAGTGTPGSAGDGGPATLAQLKFPAALRVDSAGNVYVADTQNSEIRVLTPAVTTTAPSITSIRSASQFGAFFAVAPGSWIEVNGTNLATDSRSWTLADFIGSQAPISLDHTTVTVGGQNGFISGISAGLVNVQVPSNVGPGPQPVVVSTPSGTSAPVTVTVNATQPGLYAPSVLLASGKQYTAQYNDATATFVMPAGAVSGVNSRPAHAGDIIVLFGVGFGSVTPNIDAGQIVQQLDTLTTPAQFSIGGIPANVLYQGLVPGYIGLYQINLVVPNVAAGAAVPLTFTQGGVAGSQSLFIAVQ